MEGTPSSPRRAALALCIAFLAACGEAPDPTPEESRRAADEAEAVVRAFPAALAAYDFAALDTLTTPETRWVDSRGPVSMAEVAQVLRMADSVEVEIAYGAPSDLRITVIDDVAWATYLIDATLTSASEGGLDFLRATMGSDDPDRTEWEQSFAESVVLHSSDGRWRIVLGHTTELPQQDAR